MKCDAWLIDVLPRNCVLLLVCRKEIVFRWRVRLRVVTGDEAYWKIIV